MENNNDSSGLEKKKSIRLFKFFYVIEIIILIVLVFVMLLSIINAIFTLKPNTEITKFSKEKYTVIIILTEKHLLFGNATISVSVSKIDDNKQGSSVSKRYLETKIPNNGNEQYTINWIEGGAELIVDRGDNQLVSKYVMLWDNVFCFDNNIQRPPKLRNPD